MGIIVEVVRPEVVVTESEKTTHIVEVVRGITTPTEIVKTIPVVEVVRPGGTVVNVGAGPTLPANPYEGQIWIKTT